MSEPTRQSRLLRRHPGSLGLLKAVDLFDHLKKEPDMALPKKAVAAQPGLSK